LLYLPSPLFPPVAEVRDVSTSLIAQRAQRRQAADGVSQHHSVFPEIQLDLEEILTIVRNGSSARVISRNALHSRHVFHVWLIFSVVGVWIQINVLPELPRDQFLDLALVL